MEEALQSRLCMLSERIYSLSAARQSVEIRNNLYFYYRSLLNCSWGLKSCQWYTSARAVLYKILGYRRGAADDDRFSVALFSSSRRRKKKKKRAFANLDHFAYVSSVDVDDSAFFSSL